MKLIRLLCLLVLASFVSYARHPKIHADLNEVSPETTVHVIVQYKSQPGSAHETKIANLGGTLRSQLQLVNAQAISIRAALLEEIANDPEVEFITQDHPIAASMDTAAAAVNASYAWTANQIGNGVGVAVIDSGVSTHPDVANRIVYSQDFTGQNVNSDQFGHGTHVASIIAGNGADSTGIAYTKTFRGIASGASIISLRALDSGGVGTDSSVIAAIQKAIDLKSTYNIRVMNLSLGRPVSGSYTNDPLCQAVEKAWKAGIVVVVSAGNFGRVTNSGIGGYGTITAPGNDPYVITVGAMKTMGTPDRTDDRIATYSSKGPTLYDHIVKPDIVAPGNQIHAAASPDKTSTSLYVTYSSVQFPCSYYVAWCGMGNSQDYFLLNGTSMAAPMVSGAAAILIGASPSLTPNQVKLRLMKSAYKAFPASSSATVGNTTYTDYYDVFTVGAGYLDIQAALNDNDAPTGNALSPTATYNASTNTGTLSFAAGSALQWSGTFAANLVWGTTEVSGTNLVWGTGTSWSNNIVWGTSGTSAFNIVWGTGANGVNPTNIIWGTTTNIAPLIVVLTRGE